MSAKGGIGRILDSKFNGIVAGMPQVRADGGALACQSGYSAYVYVPEAEVGAVLSASAKKEGGKESGASRSGSGRGSGSGSGSGSGAHGGGTQKKRHALVAKGAKGNAKAKTKKAKLEPGAKSQGRPKKKKK